MLSKTKKMKTALEATTYTTANEKATAGADNIAN